MVSMTHVSFVVAKTFTNSICISRETLGRTASITKLYITIILYFGTFTLYFIRSCVENLASAVHISKWTTGQHHHMIASVGEQAFNDKLGIIQCN